MEYKTASTEFKAAGDAGEYEGYFSVFGNVDDGGDIIQPGAFAKTIQERGNRIKVFFGHDWTKLIGPPPAVLQEDTRGLYAKGRLTLKAFWGNEAWELMKDGALTEGSIGYETVKADSTGGARNLREVKLYEISPVPLGMNPLTAIRAVKSGAIGPDAAIEALITISEEIKAGRVLSSASIEKVRHAHSALEAALEALSALLTAAEPEPQKGRHLALLNLRLRAVELALA